MRPEEQPWLWRPDSLFTTTVSFEEAGSFEEAEARCVQQGGHLAESTDAARNDRLLQLLLESGHERMTLGARNDIEGDDTKQDWYWVGSREGLGSYTNWAWGQPDGDWWSNDHCVELWTTGEWNDYDCSDARHFACDLAPRSSPNAQSAAAAALTSAKCPSWCGTWICDGSQWCTDGTRPAPCESCTR